MRAKPLNILIYSVLCITVRAHAAGWAALGLSCTVCGELMAGVFAISGAPHSSVLPKNYLKSV